MVRTPSFYCRGPEFDLWLGSLDPASLKVAGGRVAGGNDIAANCPFI